MPYTLHHIDVNISCASICQLSVGVQTLHILHLIVPVVSFSYSRERIANKLSFNVDYNGKRWSKKSLDIKGLLK